MRELVAARRLRYGRRTYARGEVFRASRQHARVLVAVGHATEPPTTVDVPARRPAPRKRAPRAEPSDPVEPRDPEAPMSEAPADAPAPRRWRWPGTPEEGDA